MDARVNDFLNEINEIAPLGENKTENVWEKCYDEDSGYYYYWNTKTNEVTWDMPSDFRGHHKTKTKKSCNLYIPPRTAPLFPSTSNLPPVSDAIKIYKIGECTDSLANSSLKINKPIKSEIAPSLKEEKRSIINKPVQKVGDSEDEKVVLISSYGGDSESEDEQTLKEGKQVNGSKTTASPKSNSDDEGDADILTKIQKKSTELKKLGGELPIEVKKIVDKSSQSETKSQFSLVACYSDSEEETDTEAPKTNFPIAIAPKENKISHSTLFPATKPIDIKDFEESRKVEGEEGFDSKAFQRKRRIGVALVNTGKKVKTDDDGERKGLGFSSDSNSGDNFATSASSYPGFKSGGVMFVKTDVLNPLQPVPSVNDNENSREKSEKVLKEIEDTYTTLKEKLGFLSEGREEVSPVQVMLIQIETLYTALRSGDLKQNYLRKWLDDTCADLVKLEKETTPEGWLLQWDRTHKRYYYQNAATGESQWEYPQADVTVCDEAMDICTTPPPNGAEPTIHMSPPLPPIIGGSPSPPPPPTISDCKSNKKKKCEIPLPPEPKEQVPSLNMAVERFESNGEPLPPGVDAFDVTTKVKGGKSNDMNDVLSSFYSDIAAIETSNSPVSNVSEDVKNENSTDMTEPTKKKKKTKVKLAQGIAMKKKGVSKLVEKWKSVQMSYND